MELRGSQWTTRIPDDVHLGFAIAVLRRDIFERCSESGFDQSVNCLPCIQILHPANSRGLHWGHCLCYRRVRLGLVVRCWFLRLSNWWNSHSHIPVISEEVLQSHCCRSCRILPESNGEFSAGQATAIPAELSSTTELPDVRPPECQAADESRSSTTRATTLPATCGTSATTSIIPAAAPWFAGVLFQVWRAHPIRSAILHGLR